MSLAVILLIAGSVLFFGAFIFAALNMWLSRDSAAGFDGLFKRHVGAMVFMALGSLIFLTGLILAGWNFWNRFIR